MLVISSRDDIAPPTSARPYHRLTGETRPDVRPPQPLLHPPPDAWAEVTFTASPRTDNVYGIVHGGVWLALADSAMGAALGTIVGPDDRVITAQSEFRWLRPLKGETIRARPRVLRRGRALSHCTVELFDAGGEQIGLGNGTYVVQPPR